MGQRINKTTSTLQEKISRLMTKPPKWLCAHWRLISAWASAQSDQSHRCVLSGMPRLIWVFAGRTVILSVLSWGSSNVLCVQFTIMILSFRTDMPGQTVQTQIRLLLEEQSDQGLHCLPFHSHHLDSYSMVELHSSNFRVITTNFLGVQIFRKFTVL